MKRKTVKGIMLTLPLVCTLSLVFNIQPASASLSVHNTDTGLNYATIQEAIDAPETLDGHTIFVEAGTYHENLVVDKNVSLLGENRDTTILDGSEKGAVVQVTMSSEVALSNFTIINAYTGIRLSETTGTRIENNDIRDCGQAILFWFSSSNVVKDNTITSVILGSDTGVGILFYESSNNIITENTITLNDWAGVRLVSSHGNTISENKIMSNYIGFGLSHSSGNILSGNEITDNDDGVLLYYFCSNNSMVGNNVKNNKYGITLEHSSNNNSIAESNVTNSEWWGINLYDSSNNNSIRGNNVVNNEEEGISLDMSSSNNSIHGNNVASNRYGVRLWYSPNNSISENNVRSNEYGIYIRQSSNNIFYHNNFVNNLRQVYTYASMPGETPPINFWDDSYPSGGNYWSNQYHGECADHFSGPNQDILGSDGIVDTPFVIDEDNQDNYPLMEPWTPLPRTIDEMKMEIEKLGLEGEIDNQGIVRSLIAKLNIAQKLVDKGKTEEARSILEEDLIPQVQDLSGIHITPRAADILIESAEYVICHL